MQEEDKSMLSNVHNLQSTKRTQGDGMENTQIVSNKSDHNTATHCEIPVHSKTADNIVSILPKNCIHNTSLLVHVSKEPKYVPYEPYKAAVNPRMPCLNPKKSKNLLKKKHIAPTEVPENKEVSCGVRSIDRTPSELLSRFEKKNNENFNNNNAETKGMLNLTSETLEIDNEMDRLKIENTELENQVKYQAQVNGELKKLLIAAVGEDIETRVNHLTEDKLHLAKAVNNSALKLNTHQEQMEWLAGQCEVWRSKFLASSLMVEDLAKWKAILTQKVCDYQEITKKLLAEHETTQTAISKTYVNLAILGNNFDLSVMSNDESKIKPKSSNVVDLSLHCESLSSSLKEQLLGSSPFPINANVPDLSKEDTLTTAEKQAVQCVNECLTLAFGKIDVACSAVMGAAGAVNGLTNSLSLYHPPCCSHCQDKKVQTI